jgi:hypothetical protein
VSTLSVVPSVSGGGTEGKDSTGAGVDARLSGEVLRDEDEENQPEPSFCAGLLVGFSTTSAPGLLGVASIGLGWTCGSRGRGCRAGDADRLLYWAVAEIDCLRDEGVDDENHPDAGRCPFGIGTSVGGGSTAGTTGLASLSGTLLVATEMEGGTGEGEGSEGAGIEDVVGAEVEGTRRCACKSALLDGLRTPSNHAERLGEEDGEDEVGTDFDCGTGMGGDLGGSAGS